MARPSRKLTVVAGLSVHKTWRGHNRENNIQSDDEKLAYMHFMNEDLESEKYGAGAELRALCLMSNHVHEILRIICQVLFSDSMRRYHGRYGMFFNRKHGRCGKVAQDRPHTTLLELAFNEMIGIFYVHANPLRARMVGDLRNYRWSTHHLYAFGKKEFWMRNVKLPKWYMDLGDTARKRQRKYRELFARYLEKEGIVKKQIFKRRFFGTIEWMNQNEERVRTEMKRSQAPP